MSTLTLRVSEELDKALERQSVALGILVQRFRFPQREAHDVTAFLRRVSTVVVPVDIPPSACRDPSDLPVLGTAVGGRCALLISVDLDLLDMQHSDGIPLGRPGDYWRRTRSG